MELDPAVTALSKGNVLQYDRKLNQVLLRVEVDPLKGPVGLLVLTQNHYPGWQAEIDGDKAPVLMVDATFQAVLVPPGRHVVQLTYTPSGWWWIFTLSLLACGSCVVMLLLDRIKVR